MDSADDDLHDTPFLLIILLPLLSLWPSSWLAALYRHLHSPFDTPPIRTQQWMWWEEQRSLREEGKLTCVEVAVTLPPRPRPHSSFLPISLYFGSTSLSSCLFPSSLPFLSGTTLGHNLVLLLLKLHSIRNTCSMLLQTCTTVLLLHRYSFKNIKVFFFFFYQFTKYKMTANIQPLSLGTIYSVKKNKEALKWPHTEPWAQHYQLCLGGINMKRQKGLRRLHPLKICGQSYKCLERPTCWVLLKRGAKKNWCCFQASDKDLSCVHSFCIL